MKTYDIDFRKGTLIDNVTKTPLTVSQGELSFCKLPRGYGCTSEPLTTNIIVDTGALASNVSSSDTTMELWIKTGSNIVDTQYLAMIPRGTGSTFMSILIASTQLRFYFANNTGVVNITDLNYTVKANREYHIIFERDNTSNLNIYIDNILVDSATIGGQSPSSSENMSLFGIQSSGASPNKDHFIYRFRTYNKTLTEAERNEAYIEYLNSYSPVVQKRASVIRKPTDLSAENGLVAAYNMIPSCGGILTDISGNGNNGEIVGAISTVDGMSFDGVDDKVSDVINQDFGTKDFTLAIVLKPKTIDAFRAPIGSDINGFSLQFNSSGAVQLVNSGVSVYYNSTETLVECIENIIIYQRFFNGTSKLYINGVTEDVVDNNNFTGLTNIIGSRLSGINFFNGEIQDVRIYNRALSEQEVINYHNSFIQAIFFETFDDRAVEQYPDTEWIKNSGDAKTTESIERGKYLLQTSSGINEIFICEENTNVTASIDYYDGTSWATYTDTLANLISTYSWINLDGKKLQFILDTGEAIDNVIVLNGIKQ